MLVVSIVVRAVEHSFMGTYILSGIQPQPNISSVERQKKSPCL